MSPGGGTSGLGDINSGDIINVPRWGGNVLCVDLSLWYVQLFSLCYVQLFSLCYVQFLACVVCNLLACVMCSSSATNLLASLASWLASLASCKELRT